MKNILIIGSGEGIGKYLGNQKESFQNIYTLSRSESSGASNATHIVGDVTQEVDFSQIPKRDLDIVIYIPSLWGTDCDMSVDEFDAYMQVGPRGLINCFHGLKNTEKCNEDCLFVSIGSVASESALSLSNTSSGIYSLVKLTQKSVLLQLSLKYFDFRYLNITLGSIGAGEDGGVGYKNIFSTIMYATSLEDGVRYSEVQLVSRLDIT